MAAYNRAKGETSLFLFACSEVNSTCLYVITSELANHGTPKAQSLVWYTLIMMMMMMMSDDNKSIGRNNSHFSVEKTKS